MLDSFVWVFILTIILLFLIMILKMLVDYPGMSSWKCVYMDPQPDKLEIDLSEYELAAIEIPDKRKHPQIPRPIKHKQKRDELQIFVSEVDSHSSEVISDLTSTSEVLSHHPSEVHSEITASSEASSGIVQDIHTNRNIWDAVTKAAVCDFVTKVDVCDIEKNGCGDTNLDREAKSSNSNCLSIEGTKWFHRHACSWKCPKEHSYW